jgi:hypothetical protein
MSDIIERLTELSDLMMDGRPYNDSDFTDIDEAIVEIKRLRKERDEARREICERIQMIDPNDECWTRLNPQQIAKHRGWDCYETQAREDETP